MPHIYGLDENESRLVDTAAAIAKDVVAPRAAKVDAEAVFPEESIRALQQRGFLGLCVDSAHGGLAQGPRVFVAVAEELAQACPSTAMIFVMHVAAAQAVAASDRLASRDEVLRAIAAGRHLTTLAFSERGSRSQFWAPVSRLEAAGSGFTTRADKSWVTSAHYADSFVASGLAPSASAPTESYLYLVERGAPGVSVTGAFDGMGLRGNDSSPITFAGLSVSSGHVISADGLKAMLEVVLPWFAIGTAGMANGLCRAAVAATAGHLAGQGFLHTGEKLRDLPTLRARLAQMSVATESARALTGYTLGEMLAPSATTPLYVLQARAASLEAALDVTDLAMKACGGAAFSRQLGVERLFRDARAGWVMAPTVDHLHEFVGRALTGLPLF